MAHMSGSLTPEISNLRSDYFAPLAVAEIAPSGFSELAIFDARFYIGERCVDEPG
jgi:hypothetical protein